MYHCSWCDMMVYKNVELATEPLYLNYSILCRLGSRIRFFFFCIVAPLSNRRHSFSNLERSESEYALLCVTGLRLIGLVQTYEPILHEFRVHRSFVPHYQWALRGSSKAFVGHITGLIDRILIANPQSAIACQVLVNHPNRWALQGVFNAYQLTKYSPLTFN